MEERKRFEAWASGRGVRNFTIGDFQAYTNPAVQQMWLNWQDCARPLFETMAKAVKQIEDYTDNNDGKGPRDYGCVDCTEGTVPYRLNTGLCGFHMMKKALKEI